MTTTTATKSNDESKANAKGDEEKEEIGEIEIGI